MPKTAFARQRVAALFLFAVFAFGASVLRTVAVVYLTLMMTRGLFASLLPVWSVL